MMEEVLIDWSSDTGSTPVTSSFFYSLFQGGDYMRFNLTVSVHQEDEWYVAKCLENSVASHGKSMNEALANLKEALELYYEDNDEVPVVQQRFITTMEIAV